jgi:hypothetical protein
MIMQWQSSDISLDRWLKSRSGWDVHAGSQRLFCETQRLCSDDLPHCCRIMLRGDRIRSILFLVMEEAIVVLASSF